MPPKLNKRQQRELEELKELEALKANQKHDVEESSEEDDLRPSAQVYTQNKVPTFAQLMAPEEPEESEHDSDGMPSGPATKARGNKPRKKRKKKVANVETPSPSQDGGTSKKNEPPDQNAITPATESSTPMTPTTKSERKALKKAKAKEKKSGMDELDQVLAELSLKYPDKHKTSMSSADSQSFAKLLSVSLFHLDGEAELRKFFGSKVVQANKIASDSSTSSSVGGRRAPASAVLRSNLTKPKPTWWAARQREGLSIRAYTDEEVKEKEGRHGWDKVGEEKWWTVEYSKKYKSMTKAFMKTVMSGDPQGFWNLLGKLPWHADTLLQVAEVYRHREEWAQAVDFVDRALFTYERSFIGAFNFTSGQNRLDFDHVENRPFFLAIHRQILDLQRRGCVRAAFEFARLLYSLDPWSDPHGSLLHLDFLALKAPGMYQWLLDVYDVFSARRGNRPTDKRDARMDPSLLPGWAYSRALAMWMVEDAKKDKEHKASSEALKDAVLSFPSIVPLLADKIDASIPGSIRAHKDFKIEVDGAYLSVSNATLHLLSHLYAQHAFGIWKEPAHSEWFVSVLTSLSSSLPSSLPIKPQRQDLLRLYEQSSSLRYSAYRHILVQESSYRRLFSFIPKNVTESRSLACDPLPPPNAVTSYDPEFFEGIEDAFGIDTFGARTRRQREADQRRLAQLVQDDALLRQVQEMFDANPQIAERFPGGVLQLAQMIQQLPEDAVEDIMAQLHVGAQGEDEGRMPGDFDENGVNDIGAVERRVPVPGEPRAEVEQEDDEVQESEEEDDEEESPIIIRGLRNIIGRFWGGRATSRADSSSDDEAGPIDDAGVD